MFVLPRERKREGQPRHHNLHQKGERSGRIPPYVKKRREEKNQVLEETREKAEKRGKKRSWTKVRAGCLAGSVG